MTHPRLCEQEPTMSDKRDDYDKIFREWIKADEECRRLYVLWQNACIKQERLAREKNRAWGAFYAERFNTPQAAACK
jgi:hypothetical protein